MRHIQRHIKRRTARIRHSHKIWCQIDGAAPDDCGIESLKSGAQTVAGSATSAIVVGYAAQIGQGNGVGQQADGVGYRSGKCDGSFFLDAPKDFRAVKWGPQRRKCAAIAP